MPPGLRRSPYARTPAALAGVTAALVAAAGAATLAPAGADAFCGFYVSGSSEQLVNGATRVALMRSGTRTVLTMSNDYQGPPQDFAMVVPVPIVLQRENVRTLPHDVFDHIERLSAPRLVEYWEQDPCPAPPPQYSPGIAMTSTAAEGADMASAGAGSRPAVRIEAQFVVGEYEVVVLSADESTALETWLRQNRYNIPAGAAEYLAPYIREQWKFFVARVDIERAQRRGGLAASPPGGGTAPAPPGGARLSPLRFHYDSPEFRLPVRLGLLNAPQSQDLIVYVLHPSARFEVANYRNVFIPTNLDVTDGVRRQFGSFYAQLFDTTIANAGGRAVVTEYVWSTGTCDPCPSPPLEPSELAVLGADVIGSDDYHGGVQTITRLHTRYDRATLTEDLIFREAQPAVGGREFVRDPNGGVEQGARVAPGESNAFQARYAIRHAWTGPIACANPRRGVWGGPPNGQAPETQAAVDLAAAPRGRANLAAMVVGGRASELGPARLPPAGVPAARRGCACDSAAPARGRGGLGAWLAAALAGVGAGAARRARKRR